MYILHLTLKIKVSLLFLKHGVVSYCCYVVGCNYQLSCLIRLILY